MNNSVDDTQHKFVSHSMVSEGELPFHCPPKDTQKWNMHPKVYIQFDKKGRGVCPYCGSRYELG